MHNLVKYTVNSLHFSIKVGWHGIYLSLVNHFKVHTQKAQVVTETCTNICMKPGGLNRCSYTHTKTPYFQVKILLLTCIKLIK